MNAKALITFKKDDIMSAEKDLVKVVSGSKIEEPYRKSFQRKKTEEALVAAVAKLSADASSTDAQVDVSIKAAAARDMRYCRATRKQLTLIGFTSKYYQLVQRIVVIPKVK
ncbi:MAG: hypothetical protein RR382_00330 [Tannerellaceae bacterium]